VAAAAIALPLIAVFIFNDNSVNVLANDDLSTDEPLIELADYYIDNVGELSDEDLSFLEEEYAEESGLFDEISDEDVELYLDDIIDEFSDYELDDI